MSEREVAYARLLVAIGHPRERGDERRERVASLTRTLGGTYPCEECWPSACTCLVFREAVR